MIDPDAYWMHGLRWGRLAVLLQRRRSDSIEFIAWRFFYLASGH